MDDTILPEQIINLNNDPQTQCIFVVTAFVLAYALLVFLFFLFSFYEHTLYSLSKNEIDGMNRSTSKGYEHIKKLLSNQERTLSAIMAGEYSILAVIALLTIFAAKLVADETRLPFYVTTSAGIVIFIAIEIIFGEVIPLKKKHKHKFHNLYKFSGLMLFTSKILSPLSYLLEKTSIVKRRLETKTPHSISLYELNETLNLTDVQEKEEKGILQGIVEFGNISADEIMKPRVDVVDVDFRSDYKTVLNVIRESEYSRLPVYEGSIDNVKGILYIKDLLKYLNENEDFEWNKLIRPAYFVPESKKIDDLLNEFQTKHIHMAIVVDEFGGTSGIVTLEDILEVVVGDICDEHDDEQQLYTALDERNFILEGKLLLTDFFKIKKVEKDVFNDIGSDADTLAGLILDIKGDIPSVGDKIQHGCYLFQIVSADSRRIKKVKMQLLEEKQ